MEITRLPIADALLFKPKRFGDERGFFQEIWNEERYATLGFTPRFVQDNLSCSRAGVLRGIHFQCPFPQGKLVQVIRGAIWDVIIDLRPDSPDFKKWYGVELRSETGHQLWVPPGFGHGFCVLEDDTTFLYKCTEIYRPENEGGVAWDDPALGIDWPVTDPILSEKDRALPILAKIPRTRLEGGAVVQG